MYDTRKPSLFRDSLKRLEDIGGLPLNLATLTVSKMLICLHTWVPSNFTHEPEKRFSVYGRCPCHEAQAQENQHWVMMSRLQRLHDRLFYARKGLWLDKKGRYLSHFDSTDFNVVSGCTDAEVEAEDETVWGSLGLYRTFDQLIDDGTSLNDGW